MKLDLFKQYINHPELLNDRTIGGIIDIINEYPFFQSARLLFLKNLSNQGDIRYERELKKTAIWTTDRKKLFNLLDNRVLLSVDEVEKTSPIQEKRDEKIIADTQSISNIKKITPKKENVKTDELEELILSGSMGTGTFFKVDDNVDLESFKNTFNKKKTEIIPIEKEAPKSTDRKMALIDSFIINQPKISNPDVFESTDRIKEEEEEEEEPTSSEMITDTLAQIYIKQGFYEKAINAYEKLSLKYPEKNIYFADQIKKIKKNINN